MHVSSGHRFKAVSLKACGRSLIYTKKRSGLRTEPCGVPHVIKFSSKKTPSSNTKHFLFER